MHVIQYVINYIIIIMKDHPNFIVDLGNKITKVWLNGNFIKFSSVIGFSTQSTVKVGHIDPDLYNFIDVLSLIGRQIDEKIVNDNIIYYPYHIQGNKHNRIRVLIPKLNTQYPIQTLFCILIRAIAQWSYKFVSQQTCLNILVIVPSSVTNPHRLILYQVFNLLFRKISKFRIVKSTHLIISSYYFSEIKPQKITMALDCGDRYFSVGVYKLAPVNQGIAECIKFVQNQNGGLYFTRIIVQFFLNKLKKQRGLDISTNKTLMYSLIHECQTAKIMLSKMQQSYIQIKNLPDQTTYGVILTKDKFQSLIMVFLQQNMCLVGELVKLYRVSEIVLSGGSFQIPVFARIIDSFCKQNHIGMENIQNAKYLHAGQKILQQRLIFLDLCNSNLVIDPQLTPQLKLISRNQRIPMRIVCQMKFPPGNLQFAMKIKQNQRQIGTLLLQKPPHLKFSLVLSINESQIINIQCVNQKGLLDFSIHYRDLIKKNVLMELISQLNISLTTIISNDNY